MSAKAMPTTPPSPASPQAFNDLRLLAECYEDIQRCRIAVSNRLGRSDSPDVALVHLGPALDLLKKAEGLLKTPIRRELRKACPEVAKLAKDTVGVDEFGIGRLLGVIGHPLFAQPYHWEGEGSKRHLVPDEPFVRNVAKLWAICGHGDPARRKRKGMTAAEASALGNPRAKKILYTLAVAARNQAGSADTDLGQAKQSPAPRRHAPAPPFETDDARPHPTPRLAPRRRSPYRDTYDAARLRYADAAHAEPCVRCGPAGKPAPPGSPLSDGHKEARALRLVGKEILRDVWTACAKAEANR